MRPIMRVPFIKMHGLGNDFVVLDARENAVPDISEEVAYRIADRREGIGCDQLILLEPSSAADFRMRIFNSDGGEVEACGNASRAVALLHGKPAKVETAGGIIELEPADGSASVDMGEPKFEFQEIPLDYAMDTASMPVSWGPLKNPMAVNVGNPHVVFFTPEAPDIDLQHIGPDIEEDPLFPERVNVNVAHVIADNHLSLRVWERGAGMTRACGTGACATAVAAIRKDIAKSPVTVTLPGGDLTIEWEQGGSIRMTGPATEAFRGTFEWDDYS